MKYKFNLLCQTNLNVDVETLKTLMDFVMVLTINKKTLSFLKGLVVDKSMEISNFSITPRDLIDTHHIMTLIMN